MLDQGMNASKEKAKINSHVTCNPISLNPKPERKGPGVEDLFLGGKNAVLTIKLRPE
jgi:hypothetical protein